MSVKPGLYNGRLEQHIHFWLGEEASTDEVPLPYSHMHENEKMILLRLPLLLISLLSLMSIWEEALSSTERCKVRRVLGFWLTSRRESDT